MISAGLFTLPGLAYAKVGSAVFLAYLLAGILSFCSVLCQAELVSAMPKAGGAYFYFTRSMGLVTGAIYGLTIWLSLVMKSAFALTGMAIILRPFCNNMNIHLLAILFCVFFVLISIVGLKEASLIQNIMVVVLLGILLLYSCVGLGQVKMINFSSLLSKNSSMFFPTVAIIFVSYGGLIEITSIAEEVKNPRKTIPKSLILSILTVTILYTLVVFITVGIMKPDNLRNSFDPLGKAAASFWGYWGVLTINLAALLAFITTANGGLIAASRYPYAGSKDGVLPGFFSRVSFKYKTPYVSIIATGAFMALVLLLDFEALVGIASGMAVLTYVLSFLPVFIFRASGLKNYQPLFRAPFFPWLQIAGIIGFIFVLIQLGWQVFWLSIIIVGGGVIAFILNSFCQKKNKNEYAWLYLVERFLGKKCTQGNLELELKEISSENKKEQ